MIINLLLWARMPKEKWSSPLHQQRVQNAVLGWNLKNDRMISVSKANHSVSQQSKSMPQPVMLKKLKLTGSMKTYKTF